MTQMTPQMTQMTPQTPQMTQMTQMAQGWLVDHLALLAPAGRVLDVACGTGRNALFLARRGFHVHAVDRDEASVGRLLEEAHAEGLGVSAEVVDLETDPPPSLGVAAYDVVMVFRYLHRPLFPALRETLAPGGRLVYETFTSAQAARGRPTNPAFLLQPGELRRLVAPLTVLDAREGVFDGQCTAAIVAERPRR